MVHLPLFFSFLFAGYRRPRTRIRECNLPIEAYREAMESLALIVSLMLLGEVVMGLAAITFAVLARFKGRFRRTALVLLAILAVETAWAFTVLPAFGVPSLLGLGVAAILFWWPRRKS